jgi:hypothetical protein
MTFSSVPIRPVKPHLSGVEVLLGEQPGGRVLDGPHHRLPADHELAGDRRNRPAKLTEPAARLGHARSVSTARGAMSECCTPRAATVAAAPLTLVPHQPGRLGPDRQIRMRVT